MASIDAFFRTLQFGKLEKPVKIHLQNVYATMGLALLASALGGYVHVFTSILSAGILTTLGAFGTLIALFVMTPSRNNLSTRFSLMVAFSFLTGINMGPLLDLAIEIDPSLIPTAFLATSLVFICFSLSALLADDTKWLAFGGTLFSGLSWLLLFGFLNMFIGSELLFQVYLYFGLLLMCGFVLYDTQLIVEKRRQGDDDYIMHCMDLFLDFVNIFRFILVILTNKERKGEKPRRK